MAVLNPLRPLKIEQVSPTQLTIAWSDGHTSRHTFRTLRLACQCAFCKDERTGKNLIRPERIPENIHPQKIEPVGSYGLCFHWSDKHATGIYAFDKLRAGCECDACAATRGHEPLPAG